MAMWKRFGSDQRGTMAVTFGLTALPVLAMAGVALDHNRSVMTRTALQGIADSTALAITLADKAVQPYDVVAMVKDAIKRSGKERQIARDDKGAYVVTASSAKLADNTFKVTVSGTVPASFVSGFFGKVEVGVTAVATGVQNRTVAQIEGTNLDPEAWDYNELQSYCYDAVNDMALAPLDANGKRMSAFPKVADNTVAGVLAGPANLNVACGRGEQPSFLLKNIREARQFPQYMLTRPARLFYTNAVRQTSGLITYEVKFNGRTVNTLETILCNTKDECKPKSKGGILPDNHTGLGRSPAVNAATCKAGQYVYFGWEDRVPGVAGDDSDQDFDDIRAVLSCPATTQGPFQVRLQS